MKKVLVLFLSSLVLLLVACSDAKVTPSDYSVVFFTGPNATQIPAQLNLKQGSKITRPETPVLVGKDFENWYTEIDYNENSKWDFENDIIDKSITLYAKWIEGIYTLTFSPDGGTLLSGTYPTTYKTGQNILFPTITKRGYTFNGWYLVPAADVKPGEQPTSSTQNKTGDLELFAKFTAITVQVVFRIGMAGEPQPANATLPSTQNMRFGDIINFADPVIVGTQTHRFIGWFRENGEQLVNGTPFDRIARTTLYAKWELIA